MTTATIAIDEASMSRSELYGLLADALEFPSRDFHQQVQSGVFAARLSALLPRLPYQLDVDVDELATADEYVDFQGEYIRLFDVGAVRPPCPLYGGEWGGARKRSLEETLRFYRFFGLGMQQDLRELPDHVTVELEFLQIMAFTEGMARARSKDAEPFVRAQRDFLQRHPARWWPLLRRKLPSQRPSPFYDALTAFVERLLSADVGYLAGVAGGW